MHLALVTEEKKDIGQRDVRQNRNLLSKPPPSGKILKTCRGKKPDVPRGKGGSLKKPLSVHTRRIFVHRVLDTVGAPGTLLD
jgi:hypothetical protein